MLNFMKSFYNFSSENSDVSTGATQKWPLLLSSSVKRTRETHLLTLRGGKNEFDRPKQPMRAQLALLKLLWKLNAATVICCYAQQGQFICLTLLVYEAQRSHL